MTKARTKIRTKARTTARKTSRGGKARRRRRRPSERAALLSYLGRRLAKLGKARIDELQKMYDAAYAEAEGQLAQGRARTGDTGTAAGQLRVRFWSVTKALESAFTMDAIDESHAVADLQFTVGMTLASIANEHDTAPARIEIDRAFAVWKQAARARELSRPRRLADLLTAYGFAAPKSRQDLRAMLIQAERAVAAVKAEVVQLRASVNHERALVDEWTAKARLARNIGEEDLATQADARLAGHVHNAGELESELTNQTDALVTLEGQLAELRRSLNN